MKSVSKIKINNHYFKSEEVVDDCIKLVVSLENKDMNINFDNIKYDDDYLECGIRQFTLLYFNKPIAIVSILDKVIEGQFVINYQKLTNLTD